MSNQPIHVPEGLTTEGLLGRPLSGANSRLHSSDRNDVRALRFDESLGASGQKLARSSAPYFGCSGLFHRLWHCVGIVTVAGDNRELITGLRVYDFHGGRLTLAQSAKRNLIKDGPFLLLGALPGGRFLAVLWTVAHLVVIHRSEVSQAIHDNVAKTWVASRETAIQLRIA